MADFTSYQNGYWDNTETWNDSTYPIAGDNITIDHDVIYNLDDTGLYNNIIISSSSKLLIDSSISTYLGFNALSIYGTFSIGEENNPISYGTDSTAIVYCPYNGAGIRFLDESSAFLCYGDSSKFGSRYYSVLVDDADNGSDNILISGDYSWYAGLNILLHSNQSLYNSDTFSPFEVTNVSVEDGNTRLYLNPSLDNEYLSGGVVLFTDRNIKVSGLSSGLLKISIAGEVPTFNFSAYNTEFLNCQFYSLTSENIIDMSGVYFNDTYINGCNNLNLNGIYKILSGNCIQYSGGSIIDGYIVGGDIGMYGCSDISSSSLSILRCDTGISGGTTINGNINIYNCETNGIYNLIDSNITGNIYNMTGSLLMYFGSAGLKNCSNVCVNGNIYYCMNGMYLCNNCTINGNIYANAYGIFLTSYCDFNNKIYSNSVASWVCTKNNFVGPIYGNTIAFVSGMGNEIFSLGKDESGNDSLNTTDFQYNFPGQEDNLLRNVVLPNTPPDEAPSFSGRNSSGFGGSYYAENLNNEMGAHIRWDCFGTISRELDTNREANGGGPTSIKVIPESNCSLEPSEIMIFDWEENNVYNTEQTRSIYIMGKNWTTLPTSSQLYLEAEYFGSLSDFSRDTSQTTTILKSNNAWTKFELKFTPKRSGNVRYRAYLKTYNDPIDGTNYATIYLDGQLNRPSGDMVVLWSKGKPYISEAIFKSRRNRYYEWAGIFSGVRDGIFSSRSTAYYKW